MICDAGHDHWYKYAVGCTTCFIRILRPSKKINMFLVRVLKIKEAEGLFYFIFFIENGAKFPLFRGL